MSVMIDFGNFLRKPSNSSSLESMVQLTCNCPINVQTLLGKNESNTTWLKVVYLCQCPHLLNMFVSLQTFLYMFVTSNVVLNYDFSNLIGFKLTPP